jgi:hypothetical protein
MKIAIVVNKNWEVEPVLNAIASGTIQPYNSAAWRHK